MGFKKVCTDVGHDVVKGVEYVPLHVVELGEALDHAIAAEPDLKAGVVKVVQDAKALALAAPALVTNGENVAADAVVLVAALPQIRQLLADFAALEPVVVKLYGEVKTDLKS